MLGAFAIAILWLSFRCISDRCYLRIHGGAAAAATFTLLAGWLFIFLAGNKSIRITLVLITLFALVFVQIGESNIPAAAASLAANTLRRTANRLEEEHSQKSDNAYPTTVTFAPDPTAKRFYRFEYVPLASKPSGAIDGYMLKARPLRYGCGVTRSFLFDRNGRFHTTQEDREPTESDPILE